MNDPTPTPVLRSRRRAIVATAILTVLVLGALAVKLITMQLAQLAGQRAWEDGDPVTAAQRFALNDRVNVVERWIAPYNNGVAAYGQRAWQRAAHSFEAAAETVPDASRCRVLLNWAWSLEAAGDELKSAGDTSTAHARWREAQTVLGQATACDQGASDDATDEPSEQPREQERDEPREQEQVEATEERLDAKQTGGQNRSDNQESGEADPAEQLEQRNRDGARAQQQAGDQRGEEGSGGQTDLDRRTW